MSEIIDRVALEISGGDNIASVLAIHRARARLAIIAMREPTPEMIDIARGKSIIRDWQAMIDEALK